MEGNGLQSTDLPDSQNTSGTGRGSGLASASRLIASSASPPKWHFYVRLLIIIRPWLSFKYGGIVGKAWISHERFLFPDTGLTRPASARPSRTHDIPPKACHHGPPLSGMPCCRATRSLLFPDTTKENAMQEFLPRNYPPIRINLPKENARCRTKLLRGLPVGSRQELAGPPVACLESIRASTNLVTHLHQIFNTLANLEPNGVAMAPDGSAATARCLGRTAVISALPQPTWSVAKGVGVGLEPGWTRVWPGA